jgi:hypothetical protein
VYAGAVRRHFVLSVHFPTKSFRLPVRSALNSNKGKGKGKGKGKAVPLQVWTGPEGS